MSVIDFAAAKARLPVEHSIEFKPSATFIEMLRRLTDAELAEIISVTLQESVE